MTTTAHHRAAHHAGKTAGKTAKTPSSKRWSAHVTETSDALDLKQGVFAKGSAKEIARSLKQSALDSERRKSSPFRSAMSMLTFFINRAGDNLSERRRKTLEAAKDELRVEFDRPRK